MTKLNLASSEEKILCPYCGEEMQFSGLVGWMHSPPAGAGYNWHQCGECPNCGANAPEGYGRTLEEAKEAARAAALRRFTPPIKPMTLEELMAAYDAREDHVWPYEARPPFLFLDSHIVANDNCWIPWCLVREMVETGYRKYTRESYGKTWRCWERKPTDEERGAAEWG